MKAKYFITALLFFTTLISAQNIEVPNEVKEAFAKEYPNVTDVKWSKENSEEFEAQFVLNGANTSVVIDDEGEIEEIETEIAINDLPSNITIYVKDNYSGYKITEAAKIIDEDQNVIFEAEVSKEKTKKDLLFDINGKPVIKEKISDDNKDEEDKG